MFFIESCGVVVARVMSGLFMTSLEMAGVSLTLMRADKETLRLIGKCSNFVFCFSKLVRAFVITSQCIQSFRTSNFRSFKVNAYMIDMAAATSQSALWHENHEANN